MTSLRVSRNVNCPFSAAVPLIEAFHRRAGLKVGPFEFMSRGVECELAETRDYTDRSRAHEALIVQWRSRGWPPVPRLRGMVTARPCSLATEIRIDAHYVPPLGKTGMLFDAIVGRWMARRTLERLMNAIGTFIDHEYGADRMPHASDRGTQKAEGQE